MADYFLKIKELPGESEDSKHKGEIEILSYSWGVSQAGSFGAGGGGGSSKANFQDISFSYVLNKASPLIMKACATGQHIKEALLVCRKAGGEQQEYLELKFSDLIVSSYQTGGSGDIPIDSFSLNYSKCEVAYKPQKADGSLDAPIKAGYDLKAIKAI